MSYDVVAIQHYFSNVSLNVWLNVKTWGLEFGLDG